jgi:hypothetical protein
MKHFFLFCSGANTAVLRQCPTEESKYAGIGVTILLTAILASLSGGYALFTVFRSVPVAMVFGALWGVVIFNLDRVIVSGMRKQKHPAYELVYGLPRILLSILLAVVISRPLELKLFDSEIRNQWMRMQIDARNADVATIHLGDSARLSTLRAERNRLQREVEDEQREYGIAETAWIQEREGTAGTRIPGAGPVFKEREEAMNEARRQMEEAETRNRPLILRNDSLIARIRSEQDSLIAQTNTVRGESLGFLNRMEAFGALKKGSSTIHWASIFITLLFIALETAPVMVKLLATLSPYRPYDELLEQHEFEIVEAARQNVRVRRHALKANADRTISDHDGETDTELHLATRRNQLRLDTELKANETLMERIADAQVEIAERLVDGWKRTELERVENDPGAYVQRVP